MRNAAGVAAAPDEARHAEDSRFIIDRILKFAPVYTRRELKNGSSTDYCYARRINHWANQVNIFTMRRRKVRLRAPPVTARDQRYVQDPKIWCPSFLFLTYRFAKRTSKRNRNRSLCYLLLLCYFRFLLRQWKSTTRFPFIAVFVNRSFSVNRKSRMCESNLASNCVILSGRTRISGNPFCVNGTR